MAIALKPKTYGPLRVQAPNAQTLSIHSEAGYTTPGGPAPAADAMSPSDLLLASLASCIALSMRMAAKPMGLELGALTVSATATKATDLPHRFARLDVTVTAQPSVAAEHAGELMQRTKALCTVSNTLGAEVVLNWG